MEQNEMEKSKGIQISGERPAFVYTVHTRCPSCGRLGERQQLTTRAWAGRLN